jgi:type I restriction enzyme S subunit
LYYTLLSEEFLLWYDLSQNGASTIKHLYKEQFYNFEFAYPPLPEQTAIAAYLDEKCGTIDEIIAEAKASIEEYKAWKSSVIFEAVTKGLDPNTEMKDSGVEWISKVPRHWKKTPVKSIARFINGYAFSSDLLITNALFPVIRIGDILDNGSVNFKHALGIDELVNNLEGFTIQKNDVLIAMSGATTGKVCVITEAPPKAFINQRVGIVRSCKHSKYLYYCLSTDIFKEYVLLLSAGSAQPNLSTAGIKNYQIICPPDNEIESITRYLDKKCATIDGIIAEKEALIADMEAYKKSLIFETVTGKRKVC